MNRNERIEASILIDHLIAAGCNLSVFDGEEVTVSRSTDRGAILDALGTTDSDTLRVRDADGVMLARFWLIYGNGPGELIADHSVSDFAERAWQAVQDGIANI